MQYIDRVEDESYGHALAKEPQPCGPWNLVDPSLQGHHYHIFNLSYPCP